MYSTKKIIRHDMSIEVSNCMYKMKNVLSAEKPSAIEHVPIDKSKIDILEQVNKFLKQKYHTHPDMAVLECRQQKILKQLSELKDQMLSLRDVLKVTAAPAVSNHSCIKCTQVSTANLSKVPNLFDLVINVNPKYPPFSLFVLQRLWCNCLQLDIRTYQHSTVYELSKNAQDFTALLLEHNINVSLPQIIVNIIWKEVDGNVELITSSSLSTPIYGEINVLRYLSRLCCGITPPTWNYETIESGTDIDSVLDICYILSKSRTKTERQSLLQLLNAKLGKSQWFYNKQISIADVATYSVIKQVTNTNDVSMNLNNLMQRCEQI